MTDPLETQEAGTGDTAASPEATWAAADEWFASVLSLSDPALDAALAETDARGLPAIQVSPTQGRLLEVLARVVSARRVLEIGTLGAYSTIWLARALPADGQVLSLEVDPAAADVARANLERAGLAEVAEVRLGPALESLPRLAQEGAGPFDLVFIDADKATTPEYVAWAVDLSRPGSLVVVDNVVRGGSILDADSDDPDVQGMRRAVVQMGADPRLRATVIQTVGAKGYDGLAIAVVVDA